MVSKNQSSLGLDFVNLLMTDVKDGIGVYLALYLLIYRHWDPATIGLALSLQAFAGILLQPVVGAWVDRTIAKRLLIIIASITIGVCCLLIKLFPYPILIYVSQVIIGLVQTLFAPVIAAISLGIFGHSFLAWRIGRNESFNHMGNMIAAAIAALLVFYYSINGIFFLSITQCILIIGAIFLIREKDIDHQIARSAQVMHAKVSIRGVKELLKKKTIKFFSVSMMLFHLTNASFLPLVGQKLGINDVKNSVMYLSLCIIIAQLIMVFVAPIAGRWANRSRKRLLLISFVILPVRGILYSWIDDPYLLTSIQVLDGISAGIFGVVSILMMADLSKGSGHFSLVQGVVYAAMGMGIASSTLLSGYIVSVYGYTTGFLFLTMLGVIALLFFAFFVKDTLLDELTNQELPLEGDITVNKVKGNV